MGEVVKDPSTKVKTMWSEATFLGRSCRFRDHILPIDAYIVIAHQFSQPFELRVTQSSMLSLFSAVLLLVLHTYCQVVVKRKESMRYLFKDKHVLLLKLNSRYAGGRLGFLFSLFTRFNSIQNFIRTMMLIVHINCFDCSGQTDVILCSIRPEFTASTVTLLCLGPLSWASSE